eukprot:XP_001703586.1 predicted protein [Chlamydomonas reinhardtii]
MCVTGASVPLAKLSVRMATSMQLDDVATRRADLHEDYERAAQGLPPRAVVRREDLPAAAAATLGAIRDTLARLWQKHHFWDCAVAKAVVAQINAHNPGPAPISQAQLWLVQAPPGFQQCVWDVVVMAALAATEHGRPGVNPVELACARAVADFWSRLMQFAQLGVPQKGWDGVDATHPILAVVNGRDSRHEHMQGQGMFVLLGASFEESAYEFGGCEYRLCVSASPAAAAAPGASVAAAGGCGGLTRQVLRLPPVAATWRCCWRAISSGEGRKVKEGYAEPRERYGLAFWMTTRTAAVVGISMPVAFGQDADASVRLARAENKARY